MGAPHNKDRYGELWDQHRIDVYLREMSEFRDLVVFSGGLAWHFMSPVGHAELKHAHDHKDADWMVPRANVAEAVSRLLARGFERVWTRYDRLPSVEEFRRYEKLVEEEGHKPMRVTVDFFVNDVPHIEINGYRVVDPATLLTYYGASSGGIHSSDKCFAVQAASKLLARGVSPVGRRELVEIPKC